MGAATPLPADVNALLERVVEALAPLSGLSALSLGGSWARGAARPDSDVDFGLHYREASPFAIEALRAAARRLDTRPERTVTDFGEWGPWVDGGAWLLLDGRRVDLLYRSLDACERTLAEARRGEHAWHFGQQPPFGFHGPTLLAEIALCRPLRDPRGELARLKAELAEYPPALAEAGVRDFLGHCEFSLLHGRAYAARGDRVNAAGCLTRAAASLIQVVYARNRRWFVSDKGALEAIGPDWRVPPGFAEELGAVLAAPGATPESLGASVARLDALFEGMQALCGDLYRPRFRPGPGRPM